MVIPQVWNYVRLYKLKLYAFFWVIPWGLNFIFQLVGTLCLFHIHTRLWRLNRQSVSKLCHIKFRRLGITQKKAHNVQNKAKDRIKNVNKGFTYISCVDGSYFPLSVIQYFYNKKFFIRKLFVPSSLIFFTRSLSVKSLLTLTEPYEDLHNRLWSCHILNFDIRRNWFVKYSSTRGLEIFFCNN